MSSLNSIGGYFGVELAAQAAVPHGLATLALKSARACLRVMIEQIKPRRAWLPYYTCGALLEPFEATRTAHEFYHVDECLEIERAFEALSDTDVLVYINYYGLKDRYVQLLEARFGSQLWCDLSHAFFAEPFAPRAWYFNSARKAFGVPDGAFLYTPQG